MRARANAVLLLAVALALSVGLISWGARRLLLRQFAGLEERDARQDAERALTALADEVAGLGELATDYASWDETYAFMKDRDQRFTSSELPTADHSIRVHALALLDTAGGLVFGKTLDLDRKREGPLPAALARALSAKDVLRRRDGGQNVQGILALPEGTLLVASRPILDNAGAGPSRGTLVLGRWLDAWQIEKLTRYTRFTLVFDRFDDPRASPDLAWARSRLSAGTPIVARVRDDATISGYALIEDLAERPALVLRVDAYRRIHKAGLAAAAYILAALALLGLVGLAAALGALRYVETRRDAGPASRG